MNEWEKEFDKKFTQYIRAIAPLGDLEPSIKGFISNLIAKERKAEREQVIEALKLKEFHFEGEKSLVDIFNGTAAYESGYNLAIRDLNKKIEQLREEPSH